MSKIKTQDSTFVAKNGDLIYLRQAKLNDLDQIVSIERKCFNGRTPESEKSIKKQLQKPEKYAYVVALCNGQIVGYQGIKLVRKSFRLIGLGTDPAYQHMGIGQTLFSWPEEVAKLNNIHKLYFEVRQSNPAIKLYVNNDYFVTNFKHFYYTNPREGAVIMTKKV